MLESASGGAKRVSEALDGLRRGWEALKSAAGLAAEEVTGVVSPALGLAAEWGIAAANAVNQFASALAGKSAFHMLSLDLEKQDTGFRRAAKAASAYRKTLLSFDEIHRLNGAGGSAGVSGGGTKTGKDRKSTRLNSSHAS
ncbi:MAG: hypothetical protein J5849_06825, partial [Clostridia bacterium]|nr:hypothetical protein [Clostridia bacterium]